MSQELMTRRRLTKINHLMGGLLGKQESPVTIAPDDFRYAFYRGQDGKGRHLFAVYGKAKGANEFQHELCGHVVRFSLDCCNTFLDAKCSKAEATADGATQSDPPAAERGEAMKLDVQKAQMIRDIPTWVHKMKDGLDTLPEEVVEALDTLHNWAEESLKTPEVQKALAATEELSDVEKAIIAEIEKGGKGDIEAAVLSMVEAKGLPKENAKKLVEFLRRNGKLKAVTEGRQVAKKDDGSMEIYMPFSKIDEEQRVVYGVVYEPDVIDAQGDYADADEIRKACHDYMVNSRRTGLMHKDDITDRAPAVENFLAPVDMIMGNQRVRKGTWIMAHKINDEEIWKDIKEGKLTGLSMSGRAMAAAS